MQISDLVRRVRNAAGDMAVLQFSQATLTDWINDGIRECVIENSLLQARALTNTVIGQTDYVLPADIFKLHSIYVDGKKIEIQTLEQWEQYNVGSTDTDTPISCYVYAGVLTVFPIPSRVVNITINYTKLPTSIVYVPGPPESWNPEAPPIPEAFHNHIVVYCLAQIAFQDDDVNKYNLLMSQFKSGVIDLKGIKDSEDLYPFISVSPGDQGDYFG